MMRLIVKIKASKTLAVNFYKTFIFQCLIKKLICKIINLRNDWNP